MRHVHIPYSPTFSDIQNSPIRYTISPPRFTTESESFLTLLTALLTKCLCRLSGRVRQARVAIQSSRRSGRRRRRSCRHSDGQMSHGREAADEKHDSQSGEESGESRSTEDHEEVPDVVPGV